MLMWQWALISPPTKASILFPTVWTAIPAPTGFTTSEHFYSVAWTTDGFVAVNMNGKTALSTNGTSWIPRANTGTGMIGVVGVGNLAVAVGYNGKIFNTINGAASWSTYTVGSSAWYGVIHDGSRYIALGGGNKTAWSQTGSSWNVVSGLYSDTDWSDAAHGDGVVVAAGWPGRVMRSLDSGSTWIPCTFPALSYKSLSGVAYGNGMFVVVGDDGLVFSSSDGGATWTQCTVPNTTTRLETVMWVKGMFIAAGSQAAPFVSYDGINWQLDQALPFAGIYDFEYSPTLDKIMAVGQQSKAAISAALE